MTRRLTDRASLYSMERFFRVRRQQSASPSVTSTSTKSRNASTTKKRSWSRSIRKKLPPSIVKGRESLLDVVFAHNVEELEKVIASGVEFRALDPDGEVLIKAVELGYTDMVACLLRADASVHAPGHGHLSPLHVAAKLGYTATVVLLLSNGARVNEPSKYERRTPLHLAILEGHGAIVDLLIAHGADVNFKDIYAQTSLHVAARGGVTDQVQRLLSAGANVNSINNDGWTALHLAAADGHVETVKLLLQHNAAIDAQTKYGCTALHWACKNQQAKVAVALVDAGANLRIKDLHGKTAADSTLCWELKNFLSAGLKSRRSYRLSSQPTSHLDIAISRKNSPFAQLADSTISHSGRKLYTSYEDAISQASGSSTDLCAKANNNNVDIKRTSNPFFLEVPKIGFYQNESDSEESGKRQSQELEDAKSNSKSSTKGSAAKALDADDCEVPAAVKVKEIAASTSGIRHRKDSDTIVPVTEMELKAPSPGMRQRRSGSVNRPIDATRDTAEPTERSMRPHRDNDTIAPAAKEKDIHQTAKGTHDARTVITTKAVMERTHGDTREQLKDTVDLSSEEGLRERSHSVPFLAEIDPLPKQKREMYHHSRAATLGNIYECRGAELKQEEAEQLQVKLFSMINRVNKSIADLESKVAQLQTADTMSVLSLSSETTENDSEDARDTDSAYENVEIDDVVHSGSDVMGSGSDVMSFGSDVTRSMAPPSLVLDHQLRQSNTMPLPVQEKSQRLSREHKSKHRTYKRKSLPLKSSQTRSTPICARVKRHTECEAGDDDTASIGSSVSLKSDIQDVHDKLAGLKHTFMTESEQIAKLLVGLAEDSRC